MVDSCRTCESCKQGLEQYCEVGFTGTYNSEDKHLGGMTYGGYSNRIVVDEHFVLHIPDKQNLAGLAPLLCAGITTYPPLRHCTPPTRPKSLLAPLHAPVPTPHTLP